MSWRLFERIGAQLVAFVVSIVMARLLTPEDYGLVARVFVFIAIMNTLADSGIKSALIQKSTVT